MHIDRSSMRMLLLWEAVISDVTRVERKAKKKVKMNLKLKMKLKRNMNLCVYEATGRARLFRAVKCCLISLVCYDPFVMLVFDFMDACFGLNIQMSLGEVQGGDGVDWQGVSV